MENSEDLLGINKLEKIKHKQDKNSDNSDEDFDYDYADIIEKGKQMVEEMD